LIQFDTIDDAKDRWVFVSRYQSSKGCPLIYTFANGVVIVTVRKVLGLRSSLRIHSGSC